MFQKGRAPVPSMPKERIVDLKLFFHKVRTIEATIPGEDAILVSLETPDGGRPGRCTEVRRAVAATLIAQGKARLANEDEGEGFRQAVLEAKKAADERLARNRVQLGVLPQTEIELLRNLLRKEQ